MVINDIRDHVFPLLVGTSTIRSRLDVFVEDSPGFLGTGFFISKTGIAFTAAHCLPLPSAVKGKTVVAGLWDGSNVRAVNIRWFVVPDGTDIAVMAIECRREKYLDVSFSPLPMGTDVMTVGVPAFATSKDADPHTRIFEMRLLKGHITLVSDKFETSFGIPRGMSGSPLFCGSQVVGILSENYRSEFVEDQDRETIEIENQEKKTVVTRTMSVINYGAAEPLVKLRDFSHEMFGGVTLRQFIDQQNSQSP